MKIEFGNTNSKEIWGNALLCAQFLRDYSGVELFRQVEPGDIRDITEELRPFVGVEYEGDSVKQVQIHAPEEGQVYVVALLEHKSMVDYDICFQLLKYIVGVWAMYRNDCNGKDKEKKVGSRQKGFRYPLVIPIVYYEGREPWAAAMHMRDRVELSGMFGQFVPDFTYKVVELRSYSNEELLSKEEELSLVMMLNRVQSAEDLNLARWPGGQREAAEKIIKKAPETVIRILAQMVYHFGLRLKLPEKELLACVKNVEDRDMGELWAHMEEMDIQAERKNTAEARKEAEDAKKKLEDAEKKIEWVEELLAKQRKKLVRQICRRLSEGKDVGEIADDLEEDMELVKEVTAAAEPYAPQFDAEKVWGAWEALHRRSWKKS